LHHGNRYTYVDPEDASDHQLLPFKWVYGDPATVNGIAIRNALNAPINQDIVVPVWGQIRGTSGQTQFYITRFAIVRVTGFRLPQSGSISVIFQGYADCGYVGPPSISHEPPRYAPLEPRLAQ
jgi:hypothetical protein